jgi:hypothetical protein
MRAVKGSLVHSPEERHRGVAPWLHSDVITTMMYIRVFTAALGVFAVRLTDCELPYGGGVMLILIRTRDTWSIGYNSLDYRRIWDIMHDH